MLKSFYKYLVDELLVGYFNEHSTIPGSRYYIIIENRENRLELKKAIESSIYSDDIVIDSLNQDQNLVVQEGQYKTCFLTPPNRDTKLLVGFSDTASDDYLNLLRNTVGLEGSVLKEYSIVFILSSNNMESLTTASIDLESSFYPFNNQEIKNNIFYKISSTIINANERIYLRTYLNKLNKSIEDRACTLFDFDDILSILQAKTLQKKFNQLGFFNDDAIYDIFFKMSEFDVAQRAKENAELYEHVQSVLTNNDDIKDKIEKLTDFVDKKTATAIVNAGTIQDVNFTEIEAAVLKRKQTLKLTVEELVLKEENEYITKIVRTTNSKKHPRYYIIICDGQDINTASIRLKFNKDIKDLVEDKANCTINGQYMTISISSGCVTKSVVDSDIQVDLSIIKVRTRESTFEDIRTLFTLKKDGCIVVDVPEEQSEVIIGKGSKLVEYSDVNDLKWEEGMSLHLNASLENDKQEYKIQFGDDIHKISLNINTDKITPKSPSQIFEMIWRNKITFHSIKRVGLNTVEFAKITSTDVTDEYAIYESFRRYLLLEKTMIDNHYYSLIYKSSSLGEDSSREFKEEKLIIPDDIRSCLDNIYAYFKTHNTVPSLSYIDEELEQLYTKYIDIVCLSINNIGEGNTLQGSQKYDITKLGLVATSDRIELTPFHPVLVAFMLQFKKDFDPKNFDPKLLKLISPYNIMPIISYNSDFKKPYSDDETALMKTWLFYDSVHSGKEKRSYNITTKMVRDKMSKFITYFHYLFRDKDCPLIVNVVGVKEDSNIIKGLLYFIGDQLSQGDVQKVELHEYVDNLLEETYFEKLNRLNSDENIEFNPPKDITCNDIKRQLFTRITFFKHTLNNCHNVGYSHIAFYEFNTGTDFVVPNTNDLRLEMSFNGLVSAVSTYNIDNTYQIGFGTKGLKEINNLYKTALAMNTLYANEKSGGANQFSNNACIAKKYIFNSTEILNSIYANSNWVTFLNPEVDIDFFYKQKDLYIIHYIDQYSINAKYDSITVTKHIKQYENMLSAPYEKYSLPMSNFSHFNETMLAYFNCLNGNWLLSIINKTEYQIREKMSLVASCVVLRQFMNRLPNIIWLPISLEEILRVTGSIELPMDSLFSKKSLDVKGKMSDDLLMMGLDDSNKDNLKFYFYPIEVKYSKTGAIIKNGEVQVVKTYNVFKDNVIEDEGFRKNLFSTFFASQYLAIADKLSANCLLDNDQKQRIENCRYELLNLKYVIEKKLPLKEFGNAAVISFSDATQKMLYTKVIDDVPVCHIQLTEKECYQCVAEPTEELKEFLDYKIIDYQVQLNNNIDEYSINKQQVDFDKSDQITDKIDDPNCSIKAPEQLKVNTITPAVDLKDHAVKLIVGYTRSTGDAIIFEPNNTQKVTHPNMGIIGTMGTGKTQFARSIIAQFTKETKCNVGGNPIGLLVFDYKGDYKDLDFLETVSGQCYNYRFPFNPLKLVYTSGMEAMNLPAISADTISDSFAKAYNLGAKQQSRIKEVIKETYAEFGITKDPLTWAKPAPTLSQVIEKYFEQYDADDSVYALFSKLQDYTIFSENNDSCVSMFEWLKGVRVIDLTLFPDDTKRVIVSLILDLFYAEMKKLGASLTSGIYREIRAMIMVDEAHQFLSKEFNSLRKIISEGRMFGVGMILSTQNLSDFKSAHEDYSQYILSWTIHHVNSITKSEISSIFGASDPNWQIYMEYINKAQTFQSICKLGGWVEGIRDLPYFELLNKDPRFIGTE